MPLDKRHRELLETEQNKRRKCYGVTREYAATAAEIEQAEREIEATIGDCPDKVNGKDYSIDLMRGAPFFDACWNSSYITLSCTAKYPGLTLEEAENLASDLNRFITYGRRRNAVIHEKLTESAIQLAVRPDDKIVSL